MEANREGGAGDLAAYFDAVRARVPAFTRRHFGPLGTLRLHKEAIGLDLLRAPFNVLLVGPAFFLRLFAGLLRLIGLRRLGNWLATRRLFMETRLSRRMAELVFDELLDLDKAAPDKDRLPPWAQRVEDLIAEYVAARHAVAELAAGVAALVIGLVLLQALTPSALSLGPILAQEYAQSSAIQDFWAGSWAGGYYYSWYPAEASLGEKAATTVLVMVIFAVGSTFIGLVTDPLQQALGLHRRRLERFVDTLRRQATAARTPAWDSRTPTSPGWPTWSTGSRWATG
jgi:hypothetical protein